MIIDEANGVGFKQLGEHVNKLSHAMSGQVDVDALDERGRAALLQALREYPEVLANSSDELKRAVGAPVETEDDAEVVPSATE